MGEQITPVNITAAALIAQFSIILIMSIGTALTYRSNGLYVPVLILAISSMGLLVFTDEFSKIWMPMLGKVYIPQLSWSKALTIVFLINIVFTFFLVIPTGGSKNSPFTPLYFIFPPLAIFLREPLTYIILYLLIISSFFTIGIGRLLTYEEYDDCKRNRGALWVISISCLLLTTFIGYVTRPY